MTKLFSVCALTIALIGGMSANAADVPNGFISGVAVQTADGIDHDVLKTPAQLRRAMPGLSRVHRTVRSGRIAKHSTASRESRSSPVNGSSASQSHLETSQALLPASQLYLQFPIAPRAPSLS